MTHEMLHERLVVFVQSEFAASGLLDHVLAKEIVNDADALPFSETEPEPGSGSSLRFGAFSKRHHLGVQAG
ncbi:hypothetical protein [Cupriavidus pinatubonensis]|uniref:hypothetical protein n=1 Tax=Cupriavidus pinatubonensis TaxID=248026 RepID=UPI001CC6B4AC|nr:hypothetical protein [Cupriavidus pinatubonensis]